MAISSGLVWKLQLPDKEGTIEYVE